MASSTSNSSSPFIKIASSLVFHVLANYVTIHHMPKVPFIFILLFPHTVHHWLLNSTFKHVSICLPLSTSIAIT